jgi:signal transduction histidine kinase
MNEHLTDEYKYGKPEDVWVGKLIDEYTEKFPGENYSFEVVHPRVSISVNSDGSESVVYFHRIKIAQRDFEQILDNIVTNAVKYGFTDKDKTYCIRIMIESSNIGAKEAVRITIVNNGNPLPKNMDGEKVLTYGQSSGKGEGLGGWELKNIVEHYGGNVKVESNDGSETQGFTVAYVIDFPVNNYENIDIDEI